jgi:hypothetical protein
MNEDVSDGLLIDVRASDLGELLAEDRKAGMETALDWLLESSDSICYSFNSYI